MFAKLLLALKYVTWFILLPISLFALFTWASLHWVYSSGERAGYVQKISHKGYFCKTWEGELILVSMPGTQAEKFLFTVSNAEVAKKINASLGQRIRISYKEHSGIPSSCFGESAYFVDAITVLD
jgi:hypothetical protein